MPVGPPAGPIRGLDGVNVGPGVLISRQDNEERFRKRATPPFGVYTGSAPPTDRPPHPRGRFGMRGGSFPGRTTGRSDLHLTSNLPQEQNASCASLCSRPRRARTLRVELIRQGKVREVYADGDDVILVASDRVSVYDVVLPTPIPDKGAILTQLSLWWFRQFEDLVPNHVISEDVPAEWKGRAIRCRRLEILPVECIARGYLAGLGLELSSRPARSQVCSFRLDLVEADRLPAPVFTPSTKAEQGTHDEFMTLRGGRGTGRR